MDLRRTDTMLKTPDIPILSIVSGKGGVGKTTFCLSLAQELGAGRNNVLILDVDFSNRGLSEHLSSFGDQSGLIELQEPVAAPVEGCENKVGRIRQIDSHISTVLFPIYTQNELRLFESLPLCEGREFIIQIINSVIQMRKIDVVLLDCRGSRDSLSFAAATLSHHVFLISTEEKITFLGTLRFIKGVREEISDDAEVKVHLVFNQVSENVRSSTLSYWYQRHFRSYFDDDDVLSIIPRDPEGSLVASREEFPTRSHIYSSMADKVRVLVKDLFWNDARINISGEARFVGVFLSLVLRPRLPVGAGIVDGKLPRRILMTALALFLLATLVMSVLAEGEAVVGMLSSPEAFLTFSGVTVCLAVTFTWMAFTYLCRFLLSADSLVTAELRYRKEVNWTEVAWRVVLVFLGIVVFVLGIELGQSSEVSAEEERLLSSFFGEEVGSALSELGHMANKAVGVLACVMLSVFGLVFVIRALRVTLFRIKTREIWYRLFIAGLLVVLGVLI